MENHILKEIILKEIIRKVNEKGIPIYILDFKMISQDNYFVPYLVYSFSISHWDEKIDNYNNGIISAGIYDDFSEDFCDNFDLTTVVNSFISAIEKNYKTATERIDSPV